MRHVVVHYHLFKNAGTTIDTILDNNFGNFHAHIEGENPWSTLGPESILNFATENTFLRAISSHHARLPAPRHENIVFYPVLFLRHPIDRVGSVYAFERRQPLSHPALGVKIAHERDLKGYVQWRLAEGNGATIKNFHVVHLAGREQDMRTATATAEDLARATTRLEELEFFGIVEHFSESVARMKGYLSNTLDPFDISYVVANKTADRRELLEERLAAIQDSLGSLLFDELMEKNWLDLELYDSALRRFEFMSGKYKTSPLEENQIEL